MNEESESRQVEKKNSSINFNFFTRWQLRPGGITSKRINSDSFAYFDVLVKIITLKYCTKCFHGSHIMHGTVILLYRCSLLSNSHPRTNFGVDFSFTWLQEQEQQQEQEE